MYKRKFFFGKHKGEYILDVIEYDVQYISWCIENVEFLKFNAMEMQAYNDKMQSMNNNNVCPNSSVRNKCENYTNHTMWGLPHYY